LKVALADTPVVCLLGPRQVGKTTLVQRLKPKKAYISFIEQGRNVWGVEVKRSASVQEKDGAGLARLSAQAGKNFQGGIILYTGANCLPLKVAKCFAVPMTGFGHDACWLDGVTYTLTLLQRESEVRLYWLGQRHMRQW